MLDQILAYCAEYKLITTLCLFILTLLIYKFLEKPKNLPPGPWGIPIFGYAPFLGKKPHVTIANLRKKYGDIIRINMGSMDVIYLNSFEAIKTALVKQADVFSSRPANMLPPEYMATPGVASSSGELWGEFRRFSLTTLRDLGLGKASLEPQIQDEILCFVNEVKALRGQPADISNYLRLSITNVICVIMSGQRYEYDDPIVDKMLKLTEEHMTAFKVGSLTDLLPFALQKPWLLKLLGVKDPFTPLLKFLVIISEVVDKYSTNHQPGSADNFINAWLTESAIRGSSKRHNFTKKQLCGVLLDLFMAGNDTTTTTLSWGILYMIKYPEIQTKVQEEIDEVIGKDRTPTMSDQKLMHYTEATLMEIHRIASIVPLSIEHSTTKETTLNDYVIPKGSHIMPNLWAVHHDPEIFPQPFHFNPDRFLTDNQQLKKVEQLIPFSMGKRQCLGESLARMELFLYFTSMLQNFTFKAVEGIEVDFDCEYSIVTPPKPQKIRAVIR